MTDTDKGYWHITPAALRELEYVFNMDHRRKWWPFSDRPSLSSLMGEAKRWRLKYSKSRSLLLKRAGCRMDSRMETIDGHIRRVGYVCYPPVDGYNPFEANSR